MFALDDIYKIIACVIVLIVGLATLTVRGAKFGWLLVAGSLAYAWYEWLRHIY